MWSLDQSLVTLSFLGEKLSKPQVYKDLIRKTAFLRSGLGSSSIIWDWYELEILDQYGKRVKTKSQKVLGADSHICGSYRGKTGIGLKVSSC